MGRDPRGTLGFGSRLTDLFVSGLYGVAQGICADLKRQVVRQLCDLNFDMTKREYPSVRVRDLEQVDLERITSLLMQLAGGPLITPDDSLEEALRKSLRLAPLPENLRRDKQKPASATGAAMGPAAAAASAAALPPVEEPADEELGVTGVVPPDEDEGDLNPA